ncbi:6-phosphofructo-2-kinase-domain-containing protein [Radiomyces spectabilis]|uniref:6-phosphofructo-2-kinase-domain-containing protein n=1 Tax=Radiomyces spectabilis TaxID=64574 RepID=UPI00221EF0BA|nr:6-phosphofructo-2-kinase-domain-containing protein [Radiomyces spectabilis]KAI8393425.1 6-phosphofructo-2-kinase-domain-containing protein [Radiomyces spectabilis]
MTANVRLVCVMVGLPARGKTYIAQKIRRYLNWLGIQCELFNVGNYRRKIAGAHMSHAFFDIHNQEGLSQRREAAQYALRDMLRWFEEDEGTVAIYDATNSTTERRTWLHEELTKHDIQILFIESICQDESVILSNIRDVKLSSPDYQGVDPDTATKDFVARISHYEGFYETITEQDYSYIKLINVGSQYVINMIQGFLESKIVFYLMNLHIRPKRIWFSRHGESVFNVQDKIGGDADLSPRGLEYARLLPDLIAKNLGDRPLTVWTSSMKRTIQTAAHLPYPKKQWKALDELNTGVCDGMTYAEIAEKYPDDFAARDEDKFNYRYRGGESYRDLVLRLEPAIMELERQENILIIAHQATIRCMYGYFMNLNHEELPYVRIPLHTVIELKPAAYLCEEKHYKVQVDAVDTYRPRVHRAKSEKGINAGASGEIADAASPIWPLNPPVTPKRSQTSGQ